jgi:hypothetical protein
MKVKSKQKKKIDPKSKSPYSRRSEEEMSKILQEIQSGLLTIRGACFKYGLCRNTLKLFIAKFSIRNFDGKFSNQLLSAMNDDQKNAALNKKIQELTKHLEYAKLKIVGLETMIQVAEDDLQIKIRKKRGTKQLKE